MANGWDDDEDDQPDDFALVPPDERDDWEAFDLPSWEDWFDFDWESYDGEYEEYAVSADYGEQ